jgi:PAS domain S-box-containing protein
VALGLTQRLGLLFLSSVTAQLLLRRGRVRLGGYLYVYGMILAFAILIIFNGGVQSAAFPNSIMVILTAGLILGRRTAAMTTAVVIITAFISLILEAQGMLPPPMATGANSVEWLSTSAILIISTILISLFVKGRDEASREAAKANASLKEAGELLEQRVQQRTQELSTSFEISRQLSMITDVEQLIATVVEQIQTAFDYYYVQLYLFDDAKETLTLVGATGEAGRQMLADKRRLLKGQGLIGQAAMTNEVLLIPDVTQDERWLPNEYVPETKSETAVPIAIGSDVLGVLDVQHNLAGGLDETDANLLQSIANQIAVAIQNARQIEQTEAALAETSRQAERLSMLNEMSRAINDAKDINDIYKVTGRYTQKIVGGQRASLAMVDPGGKTFEVLGLSGEKGAIPMGTHLPLDKTAVGLCIRENRLVIDGDGRPDDYLDAKKLAEQGLISTMNAPILVGGTVTGALNIGSDQSSAYGVREAALLQQIVSLFSSALENRQLLARTEEALQETSIFRQLVENAGQGIGMATLEGDLLYVNPALTTLLEINAPEEVIGTSFLRQHPEEIQSQFQQEIFSSLMEEGNWSGELQLQIHGKPIPTDENYFLLRDETGRPFQIGAIIADISERKQAEAIITRQAADLQIVADLSTAVSTSLETTQLLQDIVNRTKERFNLYHTHIYLFDEAQTMLTLAAGAGDVGAKMAAAGHSIPYDYENSLVAQVARTKQGIIVNDVAADPAFLPNPLLPDTKSEMAVPMMVGRKVIGVLDIQADKVGYFTDADINIQTTLATQIAVAVENARAFEMASEQAAIIRNAANIIATFSLDGALHTLNEAGLRRLGYDTVEDVVGRYVLSFYPPDIGTALYEEVVKAVQEQGVWQGEAMLVTRYGENFPVDQTITLIRDEDGRPKMLAFNMTDITERKQAEEAIQRSENLMRTIINSTPDWIFVKDRQHRYQLVNKAYADSVNMEPEDLVGKTVEEIGMPAETARRLMTIDEELMTGEETLIITEEEITTAEKTRYQTVTKVLMRDASGEVQGMVGFVHDVTEQISAVQQQAFLRQELEEQLQQVNALQRTMTREGWQAFMTARERPFQGFEFSEDGVKPLTTEDLTGSKNGKSSAVSTNKKSELISPVKIHGATVGKIGIRNPDGAPVSEEQRQLLISLTNQVAEALDRARLFEETETARSQTEALFSGSQQVVRAVNMTEILHALVNATRLQSYERANIFFFDKLLAPDETAETLTITAVWSKDEQTDPMPVGTSVPIDQYPLFKYLDREEPLFIDDVAAGNRLDEEVKTLLIDQKMHSILAVPLILGDSWLGFVIGSADKPQQLNDDDIRQIVSLAGQAATVAQSQRLYEEAQARAQSEQILREVSAQITSAVDAESILRTAVREIGSSLGLETYIYLTASGDLEAAGVPEKNGNPIE